MAIWEVCAAHRNDQVEAEAENQNSGPWRVRADMTDRLHPFDSRILGRLEQRTRARWNCYLVRVADECCSLRITPEVWKNTDVSEIRNAEEALGF
jgi:hypothetical protein